MHVDSHKVFCDLVEGVNFSKAAAANSITQSAVSQQVRSLESRFGCTLVERSRRGVTLTPEGQAFYAACKDTLSIWTDFEARLAELKNEVAGELRVASIFSIGLHDLPGRLRLFQAKYPQVSVKVDYRRSPQVYEMVESGAAHIGLVAYPARRPGLICEVFAEDNLVLMRGPAVADVTVWVDADGENGGNGGTVEVKQCPNWAPNPDDFSSADRLEQNRNLQGSQQSGAPEKFFYSQVARADGSNDLIEISITGHVEIHCHYVFQARVTADFTNGPVSLTVFAGKPYKLPVGALFPTSLSQNLDFHEVRAHLSPLMTSGETHGGNFKFITNDCKHTGLVAYAHGGNASSGDGGNGGELLLETPSSTQLQYDATGGRGSNGSTSTPNGGAGGQGGRAAILARTFTYTIVIVDGGKGGTPANYSGTPGTGGNGGEVTLGDLCIGASGVIQAKGGPGGDRFFSLDSPDGDGWGGDGGHGGVVHLDLKPNEDAQYEFYSSFPCGLLSRLLPTGSQTR